jgi:hypothetical protein
MLMRKDLSSQTRATPSSHLLELAEAHHNPTAMVLSLHGKYSVHGELGEIWGCARTKLLRAGDVQIASWHTIGCG